MSGATADTAMRGRRATAQPAAFPFARAVHAPATVTVAGARRGLLPLVAAHDEDADRLVAGARDALRLGTSAGGGQGPRGWTGPREAPPRGGR
ncbi:hypothetical protein BJP40_06190 [Streptomyces sp. CC53]|uniref:hypothetical protein n=1 Tax=unclassified Streptomyces TaxID=2593676 RepID=UPI0008DC67A0|nr:MULTISPECIES: hypothetical protein [unclassified Streptomyces]OII61120.1 hypothetical protein BJP40_06190 [Streptomyces sp. CC53]